MKAWRSASRTSTRALEHVRHRAGSGRKDIGQVLLAGCLVLALAPAMASAQARSAAVTGIVTSLDGARLPHARITATDRTSGDRTRSTSDHLGAFVLDRLAPGTYSILVEFPGFTPRALDVVVVGEADVPHLTIALEPSAFREVVTVSKALPRDSVEVTAVRESPARDVGELLSESAGLWKLRKGGIASDVVLRGLQSRDLNVLVDGERLYGACPNVMDPPAFHVDFSQVERIDIGKGPFDVRYQGSLGGVVNVVTERPEMGWRGHASIGAGSYGFLNPSVTASYGGRRASVLGGVSYRRSAPYEDGRGQPMTANAGYRSDTADSDAFRATTVWGRASWTPADGHRLETSYTRQQTDHTLYPYLLMDAIWDNADRLSVDYEAPRAGAHVTGLTVQAYWSRVEHWMTDAYRRSSLGTPRAYSMGTDASAVTAGGRVEATVHGTTLGAEVFRRNWNAETTMAGMGAYAAQYSIPDVDIDSAGFFVEHARALGSRFAVDVGARLDRVAATADPARANLALYRAYHGTEATSRTDVLPSGRVRVTYQISADLDLAAAVGHTARVAAGNERFFALRRMGTDWVGNPSLAPARNTGIDVSLSLRKSRFSVTGNVFASALHDYVAVYSAVRQSMVPGVMNAQARSYANVDARQWGVEANGSLRIRTPLTISGDLSYVRGRMTPRPGLGITSSDLAETPPLRARLRARLDDGRLFAELEGVANAGQTHVDRGLGEAPTASSAVANLAAGLRWRHLTLTAGVANLFDTYFVEHLSYQRDPFRSGVRVAEPGRNLFTSVLWKF